MVRRTILTVICVFSFYIPAYGNIIDNSDGTVEDDVSGLVWELDSVTGGVRNWTTSIDYCEGLSLGGESDWRLPDRNELQSIINYEVNTPAEYSALPTGNNAYWTSSSSAKDTGKSWIVDFIRGNVRYDDKSNTYYVRCVRGGPGGSLDPSASLSGAPHGTVSTTSASISVSGSNVDKYRYRLDSDSYSGKIDVTSDINLSGLTTGEHTLYVLGVNSDGKLQASDTTATWSVAFSVPNVITVAATSISITSADLGGDIADDGGKTVSERGVCVSTVPGVDNGDTCFSSGGGTGSFSVSATGLAASTKYYYNAYAINSEGVGYGTEASFTTKDVSGFGPPTVTTATVSSISEDSAILGGEVTDDGGKDVTARGVCISTSLGVDTGDICFASGVGTGVFTASATNLVKGTKYYCNAYAVNSEGTAYGVEVSFITEGTLEPTVVSSLNEWGMIFLIVLVGTAAVRSKKLSM